MEGERAQKESASGPGAGPETTRLVLLGEPYLVVPGRAVERLERKDAALLALLALEGPVPRSRAAALLWPGVDAESAGNSLRQRRLRLRRRAAMEVVCSTGNLLHLAEHTAHDLADEADPVDPEDLLALAAARDDVLGALDYADCPELDAWIGNVRGRRRAAWRARLGAFAARLEREGRLALALRFAEKLVAVQPDLEPAHRQVMRLHALRGDRAAALAAFDRCTETLARVLGTAPSQETRELVVQIDRSGMAQRGPPEPKPVTMLRPPRLVARDGEWRQLEQAWSERRVVLLAGEAGIGKTRLLSEFAAAHGACMVGARPGDGSVRYASLARLLRALAAREATLREDFARRELARVVPEFDARWTPTGDINPARLAHAVLLLLGAATKAGTLPGVVVDDLQFADAESIDLFALVVRGDGLELPWLFGARGHELPEAARQWLALDDATAPTRIDLAPLDLAGTRAFVGSLALPDFAAIDRTEAIHRHTGGNPIFILETLAALRRPGAAVGAGDTTAVERLPLPSSVGQLIEARLAQLSAPALDLARVIALAGKDHDLELAATVLGRHVLELVEPWSELERAQILRDQGFAHDLIQEAIQRCVPEPVALQTHRVLASRLQERGAAWARVAEHWLAAQAWREAATAFRAAAADALERSRRAEELALLRRAVLCLERGGLDEGRFEIELHSARAALLIDRTDLAGGFAGNALAAARTPEERIEALTVCAEAEDFLGHGPRAIELGEAGLSRALELHSAGHVLALAGLLGRAHATQGAIDLGLRTFDEHAPWLEVGSASPGARSFLVQRSIILDHAGRRDEAASSAERALALSIEARDLSSACLCHAHLGSYHVRLGRRDQAYLHFRRALALREELGDAKGQAEMARFFLGVVLQQNGYFREALEHLEAAYRHLLLGKAISWAHIARNVIGRIHGALGQLGRAWQILSDTPSDLSPLALAVRYINQAIVLRALGRPRGTLVADALRLFASHRQFESDLMARLQLAIDSEPAQGVQEAARVEEEARARMHLPLQLDAQCVGCGCLVRAGAFPAAAAMAHRLLDTATRTGPWTVYLAEIYWHAYEALEGGGDPAGARHALQEGVDWIHRVALPNVPHEFRDSFLDRNAVNRSLLTTATRRLR